jgi:hypothetical protein
MNDIPDPEYLHDIDPNHDAKERGYDLHTIDVETELCSSISDAKTSIRKKPPIPSVDLILFR